MNKYFYFKVTFISVSVGLFAGLLVYGLFDIDFYNQSSIVNLIIRSLVISFITGASLGVLNMFFQVGDFHKKDNR